MKLDLNWSPIIRMLITIVSVMVGYWGFTTPENHIIAIVFGLFCMFVAWAFLYIVVAVLYHLIKL